MSSLPTCPGPAGRSTEAPAQGTGLVLNAHGYHGDGPELVGEDPPIRRQLIAGSYAWAASYRANGYQPAVGVEEMLAADIVSVALRCTTPLLPNDRSRL